MIKGLIFDFDGLIIDTETPEIVAWQRIYNEHKVAFPLEEYTYSIGAMYNNQKPITNLVEKSSSKLDREEIKNRHHALFLELINKEKLRPGLLGLIGEAKRKNLKIGVASSSSRDWVEGHLKRLEIFDLFNAISTLEDVQTVKPAPDLFVDNMAKLSIEAHQTIVFEDSPNGITAAKKAGTFCIAIPNPTTKELDINHADRVYDSFEYIDLETLVVSLSS